MNDKPLNKISLPEDTAPHKGSNIEWWYYFTYLTGENGGKYAVMASFFRMGEFNCKKSHYLLYTLIDLNKKVKRSYSFIDSTFKMYLVTIYIRFYLLLYPTDTHMLHLYKSLVTRQMSNPHTKIKKPTIKNNPTELIYGTNRLTFFGDNQDSFKTHLMKENVKINLQFTPIKKMARLGGNGKPDDLFYYSFTKNNVEGKIQTDERTENVRGQGWFDHQWGNVYGFIKGAGWNRFGLQLDDGRELLLNETWSAKKNFSPMATIIEKNGTMRFTRYVLFQEKKNWKITIPDFSMELHVIPIFSKEEMPIIGPIQTFWEGPCVVYGKEMLPNGQRKILMGKGFIELLGYAM